MKWLARPSTRRARGIFAAALLIAFIVPQAMAQSGDGGVSASGLPRLVPDERAAAFAEADAAGALDWKAALELALWASGGSASATERARSAVVSALSDLGAALAEPAGGNAKVRDEAEYVLAFMHARFLKAYSERQTRLDTLIATGRYNCVSSAALYLILAASAGLDVEGAATVDHAFCTVRIGADRVDVETTSPYGFDPGSRTEFHDQFGKTTGFAYVSPRNYRDRSAIPRLELLSLIFSNRIVELEAAGRYAEAVGLAADRKTLLSRGPGAANADREFMDRLLNYGTSLARIGREGDALAWAERAKTVTGSDPRWDEFTRAVANNLLGKLVRAGRIAEARSELVRVTPQLDGNSFRDLDRIVTDAELVAEIGSAVDKDSTDAAVAAVAAAAARGAVDAERGRELTVYAYLKETERVARASGWAAALASIEEAVSAVGGDRRLMEARRVYRSNRVAELHNAFAVLYNKGSYAEAKAAARAALDEFPDEPRLRSDLDAAERASTNLKRQISQ